MRGRILVATDQCGSNASIVCDSLQYLERQMSIQQNARQKVLIRKRVKLMAILLLYRVYFLLFNPENLRNWVNNPRESSFSTQTFTQRRLQMHARTHSTSGADRFDRVSELAQLAKCKFIQMERKNVTWSLSAQVGEALIKTSDALAKRRSHTYEFIQG